jgi:hypothetical protein
VWPKVARAGPETRVGRGLVFSNSVLLQHFSRVERVTGIEPALSAWEPTRYGYFAVAGRKIVRGLISA